MTDDDRVTEREAPVPEGRTGWRRAAALLVVVFATSIVQPTVLVAVPLLLLLTLSGLKGRSVWSVALIATVVALLGSHDGYWFAERAWALVAGGIFAGLSLAFPRWRLTSRALASIAGTAGIFAGALALRADAWATLDWTVSDRLRSGFATWLDAITVLRDGRAPSPTLVSAIYRTVEAQVHVYPALLAVETMAALAATWWLYVRLVHRNDSGVGAVRGFRFNDHLVWVMITGLVLVKLSTGDSLSRLGANLAVFMSALYAVRGLAVWMTVSGGVSLFGYMMMAIGLLFAAPVVIGFAVVLGVADTWLDLRTRVVSPSA